MPELPDLEAYRAALERELVGARLSRVELRSPFLLRSVAPPLDEFSGLVLEGTRRLGKRIALVFPGPRFLLIHLMIAGRFRWRASGDGATKPKTRTRSGAGRPPNAVAGLVFDRGTLWLTEAGSKRRAGLWAVSGEADLAAHDPGGLEILAASREEFARRLGAENHTLKRALTDPSLFAGVGNSYSDEILHRARLSPLRWTTRLEPGEVDRLFDAARSTLDEWTARLVAEARESFPEKVTAFRPDIAVHGRFGEPCPVCRTPVQRLVYAENEANYCPTCQTEGRLLADRALSRLLREDWPRTLEDLERRKAAARGPAPVGD